MAQKELERKKKRELKEASKDEEKVEEKNISATTLPGQMKAAPQISFNLNLFQANKIQPKPKPVALPTQPTPPTSDPVIPKKKPRGNLDMVNPLFQTLLTL